MEELPPGAVEEVVMGKGHELVNAFLEMQDELSVLKRAFVEALGKEPEDLGELLEGLIRVYETGSVSDAKLCELIEAAFDLRGMGVISARDKADMAGAINHLRGTELIRKKAEDSMLVTDLSEYVEANIDDLFKRLFGRGLQGLFVRFKEGQRGFFRRKGKMIERPLEVDDETLGEIKTKMLKLMTVQLERKGAATKFDASEVAKLIPGLEEPSNIHLLGLKHNGGDVTTLEQFIEVLEDFRPYFEPNVRLGVEVKMAVRGEAVKDKVLQDYLAAHTISLFGGKLILDLYEDAYVRKAKAAAQKRLEAAGLANTDLVDFSPQFNVSTANTNTQPGEALPE